MLFINCRIGFGNIESRGAKAVAEAIENNVVLTELDISLVNVL